MRLRLDASGQVVKMAIKVNMIFRPQGLHDTQLLDITPGDIHVDAVQLEFLRAVADGRTRIKRWLMISSMATSSAIRTGL
jgi:hypothetical protein